MVGKRLALNIHGTYSMCTAPLDKLGVGRCNHLVHIRGDESPISFNKRAEEFIARNPDKIKPKPMAKTEIKGIKNPIQVNPLNSLKNTLKDPDDIEFYNDCIDSIRDYSIAAVEHKRRVRVAAKERDSNGARWYREEVSMIDTMRSNAHNVAMSSLRVLNKLAEQNNIPAIYPGDLEKDHRDDIAESIFKHTGHHGYISE